MLYYVFPSLIRALNENISHMIPHLAPLMPLIQSMQGYLQSSIAASGRQISIDLNPVSMHMHDALGFRPQHYNRVAVVKSAPASSLAKPKLQEAHRKIPDTASSTPKMLPSEIRCPAVIQPRMTIEQVFKCPATVLLTGPAPEVM